MARNINIHNEMIRQLTGRILDLDDLRARFDADEFPLPQAGDAFAWNGQSHYSNDSRIEREAILTAADIAEAQKEAALAL